VIEGTRTQAEFLRRRNAPRR